MEFTKDFIAGWIGGCAGLMIGHPFDTIKVRLQTSQHKGLWDCISKTYRYEQIGGFYRGMGFPLLSVGILNSILFGVYGNTIRALHKVQDKGTNVTPNLFEVYVAGFISGAAQVLPACPVDVIKVKLQSQTAGMKMTTLYKGPMDCCQSLYRNHHLHSLFKGLGIMTIRDLPSNALYFFLYEFLMRTFRKSFPNDIISILVAGAIAGASSWFIILPFDLVKSRMQAEAGQIPSYTSIRHCFKESYKEGGWRIFFRGGNLCILRALPVNSVIFLTYTISLNSLNKFEA